MIGSKDVYLPEVLFEFYRIGKNLRVNAIDPRTGVEVSMIADPRYGETLIKRLAARKLAYVIAKRRPGLLKSGRLSRRGGGTDEIA